MGEERIRLIERERSKGAQQRADGPDVGRDIARVRGACRLHRSCEDVLNRRCVAELERVGAEGIGGDHLAACFNIGGVHASDDLRVREVEELGDLARRHARGLQHGAHAAVEEQVAPAFEDEAQVFVGDTNCVERAWAVGLAGGKSLGERGERCVRRGGG